MRLPHTHHAMVKKNKGISIAFWFTMLLFIAEIIGGYLTNSLAILSDAWHLLSDILALGVSWFALRQSTRPANKKLTFGYHRIGIFAALINNLSLIGISGYIYYTAIRRIFYPEQVESIGMIYLAILGVLVTTTIVFFLKREDQNLNVKSALLHFVGDVFSYAGVIIGGILLNYTGWMWIDPVISILFASVILKGAFRMLRESIRILLEAVPDGLDLDEIKEEVIKVKGVCSVHDVHVWGVSSEEVMLTAHIVTDNKSVFEGHRLLHEVKDLLNEQFGIWHSILQLETIENIQEELDEIENFNSNNHVNTKIGFNMLSMTKTQKE